MGYKEVIKRMKRIKQDGQKKKSLRKRMIEVI